jgi:hypothetical protein
MSVLQQIISDILRSTPVSLDVMTDFRQPLSLRKLSERTLAGGMDFDGYFTATEQAFVQEKQDMLDRVEQVRHVWDEAVNLDGLASKKCEELQTLKNLLSKGHLQILRTREETIRIELQNALTAFRVRQLQNEIWRFLPYTHKSAPSIDYQLSIARSSGPPLEGTVADPDEKVVKEIGELHQKWKQIMAMQESVAQEEIAHRRSDDEYFERFAADFKKQNAEAHKSIDQLLNRLIRRLLQEKGAASDAAFQHKSMIDAMNRKQKVLDEKAENLRKTGPERAMAERNRTQKMVAAQTNAVRERIRRLERANMLQYAALKERNTVVHQKHRELLALVLKLRKQEKQLLQTNYELLDNGRSKIDVLKDQMNALISAVTALETCPATEADNVLRQVAAVLGAHGSAVRSAQNLDREIQNLADRLSRRQT